MDCFLAKHFVKWALGFLQFIKQGLVESVLAMSRRVPADLNVEIPEHQDKSYLESPVAIDVMLFEGVRGDFVAWTAQFQELVDPCHDAADIIPCNSVPFSTNNPHVIGGTHSNETSATSHHRLQPV